MATCSTKTRKYIPSKFDGNVVVKFLLDEYEEDNEVRGFLREEIHNWLAQFGNNYCHYGLEPDDPGYEPKLCFPLEVQIILRGSLKDKRDRNEMYTLEVRRAAEGLHGRYYRYEGTLMKLF